jgi:putative transposase
MPFQHKNIRLPSTHYIGKRWHFVTFCSNNRVAVFSRPPLAKWLIEVLRHESAASRFAIHAYSLMPDHLHILAMGTEETSNLLPFVKGFKQKSAFEYKAKFRRVLWQKKSYDHILRPKDSVERVAAYIWMNPVRRYLAREPGDYPFSGSFTIDWKQLIQAGDPWIPPWKSKTPA